MKKITLWSIALIALSTAACRKSETPSPDLQPNAPYKKTAAGGGNTSSATTTTYSGQATGVNATVMNTSGAIVTSNQTILSQTSALPATGGSGQASLLQASITGTLTADSLGAVTSAQNGTTRSESAAKTLSLTIGTNVIAASTITSTATSTCGPITTASTQITNLMVNGTSITVTGAANQAIYLSNGGFILLNEQSTSKKGSTGTVTVSGLHIIVPNKADIRIATATAGIKC
jgi:hypothetical protein